MMDQKMKNFCEGQPKKRANLDVRELLHTQALCSLFLLLFEDPTTFKRYETKNNEREHFYRTKTLRGGTYVLK